MELAHRIAWELKNNGPVPDGQCVLHHCDNPPCVNPNHLFLGTNAANMLDMVEKDRQARGEQHGESKLTEVDVRQIRRWYDAGMTKTEIAKKFGVSRSTIYRALSGVNWKHVTP